MMNFNVLFHHTVFVTLEDTPSTNTFQISFCQPFGQILQRIHAVKDITVTTPFMFVLFMLFKTDLIVCFIIAIFTLPKFFFMMNCFYMPYQVIFS